MHLIQYMGGFLFPCMDELQSPPADGVYKTTVDHAKFLEDIQQVCLQVLPPRDFFKVGCHIFRKTYYVFGIFGNAHDGDLQGCARHLTVKYSMKYARLHQASTKLTFASQHQKTQSPSGVPQ
jgi:hypothetical protein